MRRDKIKLGYLDIPQDYFNLDDDIKRELCNDILDGMFVMIDKELQPNYNRLEFLREILESSLQTNIDYEHFEVAGVINDCIKLMNEDRI